MVSRTLRSSLLVVLVMTAVVLGGCVSSNTGPTTDSPVTATDDATSDVTKTESTATVTDDEVTNASVPAQFAERLSTLDSYTATKRTRATFEGNTTTVVTDVWARPATGEVRREIVSSPYSNGTISIVNETTMVTFDPGTDEVTRIDRSNYQQRQSGVGITMLDTLQNRTTVEQLGTERRDGERTYRVRLVPESDGFGDTNITAWLDARTYFPVRIETRGTGNVDYTSVVEYEDVEVNPTIPDSTFRLDAPADANVSEYSMPESRVYESLSALQRNASMSVPDPDVPAAFTLRQARETRGDTTSIALRYNNGSASISVTKINGTVYNGSTDSETVQIGDQTGAIDEFGSAAVVRWSCDGRTYSVSGSVSRSTLLDVAASVECA